VVVVEDDEVIRGMLVFLLEGEGHTVEQAADGAEALEILRRRTPECIVLDLMMPGVDGLTVLRTRQEEGFAADARVVVLTARSGTDDAVWCWEAGADEFLTKPFEPERLLRIIRVLASLTPVEAQRRRELGLAQSRHLDAIESALRGRF